MTNLKLTKRTSRITFPVIIKYSQPKLLANDIVSVQAMPMPESRLFYMDYGENEEIRIARYEKEELEAYSKEVDAYINDLSRFIFISPGVKFRETEITFVPSGIEYAADYSAQYTNRSIIDRGGYIDQSFREAFLQIENEKRIAKLINEDFESYDHEVMIYLN